MRTIRFGTETELKQIERLLGAEYGPDQQVAVHKPASHEIIIFRHNGHLAEMLSHEMSHEELGHQGIDWEEGGEAIVLREIEAWEKSLSTLYAPNMDVVMEALISWRAHFPECTNLIALTIERWDKTYGRV